MNMNYTERSNFDAFFERCMHQSKVLDEKTGKLVYPRRDRKKTRELLERLRNRRKK